MNEFATTSESITVTAHEIFNISRFSADFEESTEVGNNTFEIQIPLASDSVTVNDFIYEDSTELGGIVDSIKINTASSALTLYGRTWRGVLGSKILEPSQGKAYYSVSGDANVVLAEIIAKIDLAMLFSVSSEVSKIITWKFNRYEDAYTGIVKMLSKNGMKLKIVNDGGIVRLSCVNIVDYSSEEEITANKFDFIIEKKNAAINHIIGLGSGELENRIVCHKYLNSNGSVDDMQHFFGKDEIVGIYDYPNCESVDELTEKTVEELEKHAYTDSLQVSAYDLRADIGDKFIATDVSIGISVEQYVIDKIITATDSTVTKIEYKVGGNIL